MKSRIFTVLAATRNRADFDMVEDIMKEHPIPGWEKWGKMSKPAGSVFE